MDREVGAAGAETVRNQDQEHRATEIQDRVEPSGIVPELGRAPSNHVGSIPRRVPGDAVQFSVDRDMDARPEGQISKFPRGLGGRVGDRRQRLPLDDNDKLADMIKRALWEGLVNRDLEDVNRSPFTPVIRQDRNPPDFKLPTLEMYDGRTSLVVHLTRYMGIWKYWGHQRSYGSVLPFVSDGYSSTMVQTTLA